jgi:hypothetical protein
VPHKANSFPWKINYSLSQNKIKSWKKKRHFVHERDYRLKLSDVTRIIDIVAKLFILSITIAQSTYNNKIRWKSLISFSRFFWTLYVINYRKVQYFILYCMKTEGNGDKRQRSAAKNMHFRFVLQKDFFWHGSLVITDGSTCCMLLF